jgi:hypothetical protein
MRPIRTLFVVGAVLGSAVAIGAPAGPGPAKGAEPAVDPKADALLRKMAEQLANMKSLQVDTSYVTEVVTKDGQKIQLLGESRASVERPNKLRSDRLGPNAGVVFYYDGNNVTVYGKRANLYATAKAPNTLDKTIDFTRNQLGLEAPAADLLYSQPYLTMMEDVVSGKYIGKEPVGRHMCHHLAYRGHETDWQIWIQDGPHALPCRYVITSKKIADAPEFEVDFTNWKVNPPLSPSMFVFTPPRGATRINFLAVAQRQKQLGAG